VSVASILFFGFLIGLRHALEADHVAAVATLATRQTTIGQTMIQGAAWGVGHTLTLAVFGGIVLAMGKALPEDYAQGLEFVVGLMLVALGADVLRRLWRDRIHFHTHVHEGGERHFHAHSHVGGPEHGGHPHLRFGRWPVRALCVGMVHGMAGSAALVLLALERVGSVGVGLLYILLFGVGSILGMALLSIAIALPLRATARRLSFAHQGLVGLVGLTSCLIGLQIVYSILRSP
jgi:ABC-type nickel/cobalt efflux system permease component RcnA